MNGDYVVVLDACVLVNAGLRDTILRLAETPRLFIPKWSEEIIAETTRTLQKRIGRTKEDTDYLCAELRRAFPEAWVSGYQSLEAGLTNHPKDRHVLAAAIVCGAQQIITFNLKHFPDEALAGFGISARHPDRFLFNQFNLNEALVVQKFSQQAHQIGRTVEQQLRAFHRTRALPLFTQTMAAALSISLSQSDE